jgi:hypothetical protein
MHVDAAVLEAVPYPFENIPVPLVCIQVHIKIVVQVHDTSPFSFSLLLFPMRLAFLPLIFPRVLLPLLPQPTQCQAEESISPRHEANDVAN